MAGEKPVVHVAAYAERLRTSDFPEQYDGLAVFALAGLHGFVESRAVKLFPPSARILDLGSGSGALGRRLVDSGFRVTCCDVNAEVYGAHGRIPFEEADLNGDFAASIDARFDAITAVEIIEHLENPWHFLRQCRALLRPGGAMVLTTPNIDTPRSILSFALKGTFKYFDDHHFRKDGHLSPISQWQLRKCIAEAGFALRSLETFGEPYGSGPRHLGAKLLRLLAKRPVEECGVINVACVENPP